MSECRPPKSSGQCECSVLQRGAQQPDFPIKFDSEMNEYYFSHINAKGEEGKLIIYYCFFCGGAAPESLRASKFAVIGQGEMARLMELTKDLQTVEDVISRFGQPEWDTPRGMITTMPSVDLSPWALLKSALRRLLGTKLKGIDTPELTESFRALSYSGLSETADVLVTVRPDGKVHFGYVGKYIGDK